LEGVCPNLSKIEKVAETCEFDGKEPLFVERTITKEFRDEHEVQPNKV